VANSTQGNNCFAGSARMIDGGGNLDDDGTCGFTASTSKSNTPAGLDPAGLQDNGGPTQTIALCSGVGMPAGCTGPSAAIDAAVSCPPPTTDQRGVSRPQGSACDIGSFELDTTPPSVSCSVSPSTFRLPANNHKLVTVKASVTVTDNTGGSGPNGFTLVSVSSDQDDSGLARDDVPNDIQGWTLNTADIEGQLRAERYGTDRVYTLTYQGKDKDGNTANCTATVTVSKPTKKG
jgi:hypothetical protein